MGGISPVRTISQDVFPDLAILLDRLLVLVLVERQVGLASCRCRGRRSSAWSGRGRRPSRTGSRTAPRRQPAARRVGGGSAAVDVPCSPSRASKARSSTRKRLHFMGLGPLPVFPSFDRLAGRQAGRWESSRAMRYLLSRRHFSSMIHPSWGKKPGPRSQDSPRPFRAVIDSHVGVGLGPLSHTTYLLWQWAPDLPAPATGRSLQGVPHSDGRPDAPVRGGVGRPANEG